MQHHRLRKAGLDRSAPGRVFMTDDQPEHHHGMRRQASHLRHRLGLVAHRTDIDRAQAQRFGCDHGILRSERGIDHGDGIAFEKFVSFGRGRGIAGDQIGAGQIGHEQQDERGLVDMALTTGEFGKAGAFRRVFDRDHAPQLQV